MGARCVQAPQASYSAVESSAKKIDIGSWSYEKFIYILVLYSVFVLDLEKSCVSLFFMETGMNLCRGRSLNATVIYLFAL